MFPMIFRLPVVAHLTAAALAFGVFLWVKGQLDASYAASGHPVDYATGQLAFDARIIEGYYAHMIETGSLQIYWQTQFIDFGFIAAVMTVAMLFGTLAARFGGRINRLGVWGWPRQFWVYPVLRSMRWRTCCLSQCLRALMLSRSRLRWPIQLLPQQNSHCSRRQ